MHYYPFPPISGRDLDTALVESRSKAAHDESTTWVFGSDRASSPEALRDSASDSLSERMEKYSWYNPHHWTRRADKKNNTGR
jgi:hypothetical protein